MIATTTIRVRYKDTDCMNVVYYGNYLTYFEVGRVEYLRQAGMTIAEINDKVFIPVAEASVKYHRPARLDELLEVRCWISERKRASFRFEYAIGNEARERVATGHTVHAVLDRTTSRMMAIPPWMAELLPVVSGGAAERV
jgi:acyl-CoA thioester hydrolase